MPEGDRTVIDGIAVTTVVRTIIDIAPELAAAELDRVVHSRHRPVPLHRR